MGAPMRKDDEIDSTFFFAAVKAGENDAAEAAGRWAGVYAKDESKAVIHLLRFLFQSCGAASFLEADTISDDVDVDDVVRDMVTVAMEGKVEDTLGSKQKGMKNFKQNLLIFWDSLVSECQTSFLYDDKLLNRVSSFVIALASSSPRIYRHVATITALQLVSSLITVANSLTESRQTFERQLGVEQSKSGKAAKLATLQKNIDDVVEKTSSVEALMRNLITGVFMHRYRDTDPDIRLACISFLGSWIDKYPSYYLTDQYLKYIGWMLNDKIASVRLASLSALVTLYENPDFIPALSLFTERFLQRLIQLAEDVDVTVAVQALSLQKLLLGKELIGEEDVAPLYDLLFDENSLIRHAIGTIVYEQKILQGIGSPAAGTSKAKAKKGSETQISSILQLLVDKSDTGAAAYVVDALWESSVAMQDWKAVCKMLLAEQSKEELSHEDTVNLAFMLSASVKRSVQVGIVSSAEAKKVNLSKAQKGLIDTNRQELTTALMKPLPQLLRKYLPDADIVQHLVEIIHHLDLELFSIKRRESNFSAIINLLKDAFFKHGKPALLSKCIQALSFCAKEGHAELKDVAQHVLFESGVEVVTKLQNSIAQVPPEGDEDYSLIVDLRRFCHYQQVAEAGTEDTFQGLCGLLDDLSSLDDESFWLALFNLFLQVSWSYASLDSESPDETGLAAVVDKRTKLMDHVEVCMEDMLCSEISTTSRRILAAQLVEMVADCWSLFSQEKLRGGQFEALGYEPSDLQIKQFWKLCEELLVLPDTDNEEGNLVKSFHGHESTAVAAAKLVVHKLVPQDYLAPEIVSHFVLHDKPVTDVVKRLCSTLKERSSPAEQADLYLNALKKAYERHLVDVAEDEHGDLSKRESYVACRELASRLAVMYAAGKGGNRSGILKLVGSGIAYAFKEPPKQVSFLEAGVLQFVQKLGMEDARKVLAEVEVKVVDADVEQDPSAWRSFVSFTDQLRERCSRGEADAPGKADAAQSMPPPKARGRPRKTPMSAAQSKKLFTAEEEEEEEAEEEEDDISEDEEEAPPPSRKRRPHPDFRPSQESQRQTRQHTQRQSQRYESSPSPTPTPTLQTAAAATVTYSRKRRGFASPDPPQAAATPLEGSGSQEGLPSDVDKSSEGYRSEGAETEQEGWEGMEEGDVGGTEEVGVERNTATEEQLPVRRGEKRQRFQPLFDSDNEDDLSPSPTPDDED